MTEYKILRLDTDRPRAMTDENPPRSWEEVDMGSLIIQATSPSRALKLAEVGEGSYVAIPKRSWKPVTVKVEQTTKITIG